MAGAELENNQGTQVDTSKEQSQVDPNEHIITHKDKLAVQKEIGNVIDGLPKDEKRREIDLSTGVGSKIKGVAKFLYNSTLGNEAFAEEEVKLPDENTPWSERNEYHEKNRRGKEKQDLKLDEGFGGQFAGVTIDEGGDGPSVHIGGIPLGLARQLVAGSSIDEQVEQEPAQKQLGLTDAQKDILDYAGRDIRLAMLHESELQDILNKVPERDKEDVLSSVERGNVLLGWHEYVDLKNGGSGLLLIGKDDDLYEVEMNIEKSIDTQVELAYSKLDVVQRLQLEMNLRSGDGVIARVNPEKVLKALAHRKSPEEFFKDFLTLTQPIKPGPRKIKIGR